MRQSFATAFENLQALGQNKEILTVPATSVQESFLQTLGNIKLCNQNQAMGDVINLLNNYKGAFSNQILFFKYCTYCMEKDKSKNYPYFIILKLLAKWVETLEAAKKKKDVRLYETVIETLDNGIATYQQIIVYLNYIGIDLVSLIKSGTQQTKKKYPQLVNHPHLDAHDLIKFLNAILPKVLINIMVPRNFFPPTLLKSTQENVDILYCNQILENIAQNKGHYNSLLRNIIKCLLSMELEPSQIKQLILCSFKYYYIYHHDKNCCASQYIIQSLKKMTSAVRYAINDEISLFLIVLKKLGKQLFISYLSQKFSWISQVINSSNIVAVNKGTLKPYYNQAINNVLKLKIDARKIEHSYLEVYDRFSMIYFFIDCQQLDITIRFYYLGKFNQEEGPVDKKLLFFCDKKQGVFEGSIQALQQGIYMFEFDNSYSWMKGKNISYESVILAPLQLKQQAKNKLKPVVFQKYENMNEVPFQNVTGWVDQNEIKINSTSANVNYITEGTYKFYNVKLIKNTGQAYQFQTDSKSRFLKKLKILENDPNLFWLIDGYKVKSINEVQRWLDGQFEIQRLKTSHQAKQKQKQQQNQLEEQLQEDDDQKHVEDQQTSKKSQKKQNQKMGKSNKSQETVKIEKLEEQNIKTKQQSQQIHDGEKEKQSSIQEQKDKLKEEQKIASREEEKTQKQKQKQNQEDQSTMAINSVTEQQKLERKQKEADGNE